MKREPVTNILVFCMLVGLGVATRWMSDAFSPPVEFHRDRRGDAVCWLLLPQSARGGSHAAGRDGYQQFLPRPVQQFGQFAIVYIALLLPVVIGMVLKLKLNPWTVLGGSLASSISFYLLTNFAEWAFYTMYPHTAAGVSIATLRVCRSSNALLPAICFSPLSSSVRIGLLRPSQSAFRAGVYVALRQWPM